MKPEASPDKASKTEKYTEPAEITVYMNILLSPATGNEKGYRRGGHLTEKGQGLARLAFALSNAESKADAKTALVIARDKGVITQNDFIIMTYPLGSQDLRLKP